MRRPHFVAVVFVLFVPSACTTFSAARPADVELGNSWHGKIGIAVPFDPAVSWFSRLDECYRCNAAPQMMEEVGFTHAWRSGSQRKHAWGLFLNGVAPTVDLYAQLHESPTVNWGVGVQGGLVSKTTYTAKLYALHDRPWRNRSRILLNPGLVYLGNLRDPDGAHGASSAWLLGLTQAVGVEFDVGTVTYTPHVTIVGAHGEIGGDGAFNLGSDRRVKFNDVFLTAAIGVTFRKVPR